MIEVKDRYGRTGRISRAELEMHSNPASTRYWGTEFHVARFMKQAEMWRRLAILLTYASALLIITTVGMIFFTIMGCKP